MNICVGNLPYRISRDEIKSAFEAYGEVDGVRIIKDKQTNRSKGFAFVEMKNDDEAKKAIEALNDSDLGGRQIRVNEARPKEQI